MAFELHPQLAADTLLVGDLAICRVLLMNNCHFPWLVLVPRREGLSELFDLKPEDYKVVMDEIHKTAKQFAKLTNAHKINIAALGNQVPQLHIHIIARLLNDSAWPQTVWNLGVKSDPYPENISSAFIKNIKLSLAKS